MFLAFFTSIYNCNTVKHRQAMPQGASQRTGILQGSRSKADKTEQTRFLWRVVAMTSGYLHADYLDFA